MHPSDTHKYAEFDEQIGKTDATAVAVLGVWTQESRAGNHRDGGGSAISGSPDAHLPASGCLGYDGGICRGCHLAGRGGDHAPVAHNWRNHAEFANTGFQGACGSAITGTCSVEGQPSHVQEAQVGASGFSTGDSAGCPNAIAGGVTPGSWGELLKFGMAGQSSIEVVLCTPLVMLIAMTFHSGLLIAARQMQLEYATTAAAVAEVNGTHGKTAFDRVLHVPVHKKQLQHVAYKRTPRTISVSAQARLRAFGVPVPLTLRSAATIQGDAA